MWLSGLLNVAQWPPFWKELLTWLTIYLFALCLFIIKLFPDLGFRTGFGFFIWVLIVSVSGNYFLVKNIHFYTTAYTLTIA